MMCGVGVLGVGLLLMAPAQAAGPDGTPAQAIYGWLAAGGVEGDAADRGTSFKVGADPDAQAIAAGAMASLGANLAPNPLAACWAQFPVTDPAPGPKRPTGSAAAVAAQAIGPLVLYGGRPDRVIDCPRPPRGPYSRAPLGGRLAGAAGGVPIVGGGTGIGDEAPTEPSGKFDATTGGSAVTGLPIPPGGWVALGLDEPLDEPPVDGPEKFAPPEVIRQTTTPPVTKAPIATPEPGTLALAAVGLAALAGGRRRRVSPPSASAG